MDYISEGKIDTIEKETDKAVLANFSLTMTYDNINTWSGSTPWAMWIPKSCIDDDGKLTAFGRKLLSEKMNNKDTKETYKKCLYAATGHK
jgi:hypothetical protein